MKVASKILKEISLALLILLTTTFLMYFLLSKTMYEERSPGEIGRPPIKNVIEDYYSWITTAFTSGYLGHSTSTNREVSEIITTGFSRTFILVIGSLFVSLFIAVPIAIMAAVRSDSIWVKTITNSSYLFSAIPIFLLAVFIRPLWVKHFGILDFSEAIPLFRLIGYYGVPVIILGIGDGVIGEIVKHMRDNISATIRENYIRAVLARNASLWKHITKNILIPFTAIVTSRFAYILGGAIIVEYIFFSQGISIEALRALRLRDPYVLLAIGLIFSVLIVMANLLNRFVLLAVDPRTRE